jgi:hypothetical protein
MPKIKVKAESFATRCEICHQADLYDPELNQCQRCIGIEIIEKSVVKKSLFGDFVLSAIFLIPIIGMLIGLVIAGAYLSAAKFVLVVATFLAIILWWINKQSANK